MITRITPSMITRITPSQMRTVRQTMRLIEALREDHAADDAGVSAAVLAHACALTTAQAERLLRHLERRGLVRSVSCDCTGRTTWIWRLGSLGRPRTASQGDTT